MSKKFGGKIYTCGFTKSLGFKKQTKKNQKTKLAGQDEQTEIDWFWYYRQQLRKEHRLGHSTQLHWNKEQESVLRPFVAGDRGIGH